LCEDEGTVIPFLQVTEEAGEDLVGGKEGGGRWGFEINGAILLLLLLLLLVLLVLVLLLLLSLPLSLLLLLLTWSFPLSNCTSHLSGKHKDCLNVVVWKVVLSLLLSTFTSLMLSTTSMS